MTAFAIIGANFGDEGKGSVVDLLATHLGSNSLVIRFNGSAQAGHTVELENGTRFTFHHIGAGSLRGCPTFLSRFFVCHPMLFHREYRALSHLMKVPQIYVDRQCLVTTPYDVWINQTLEQYRGESRHGSVGVGFGETIERSLRPCYDLRVKDLLNPEFLLQQLLCIRTTWVSQRCIQLGIAQDWRHIALSASTINRFMEDCAAFLQNVQIVHTMPTAINFIFEGAQGLQLDEKSRFFPHVTRSRTGMHNVKILCEEQGIRNIQALYCSRPYFTRHGAGPLPGEEQGIPYPVIDKTNIDHEYQGSLRFAPLDFPLMREAIQSDAPSEAGVMFTCLDQIPDVEKFLGEARQVLPWSIYNTN